MTERTRLIQPKRATMTDVARLAGVSQTTVSFVVNNLDAGLPEHTKKKVLQACAELNYSPNEAARRLASRRSHAIGLAIYDITAIANYRQSAGVVIASIYRAAETRQQRLQIYTTHERREDGADIGTYFAVPVRSHEVDGIIIWDSFVEDQRILSTYNEGLSMVTLDRRCGNVPAVVPDYEHGFRLIAEYLLRKGYDTWCLAIRQGQYYRDSRARGAIFSAAMDHDIPINTIGSIEVDIEAQTDPAAMAARVDDLLSKTPRPRAVICMYDTIALGLMAALKSKGVRVPEDIAVVGCAGVPASDDPAYNLTTLNLRHDLMGQHAVDLVLGMVRGDDMSGSCVVVQPELVVRKSA